jgi:putative membrane protein
VIDLLVKVVVSAVALVAAIELVPGIDFDWQANLPGLLVVALIFGLVNAYLRPIVKALALPISFFTMGLVGIVINVAMLLLTAFLASQAGITFDIGGWPSDGFSVQTIISAVLAALLISVVSTVLGLVFSTRRVVGL